MSHRSAALGIPDPQRTYNAYPHEVQNGRLVEQGDVRQILRTPQHPYTQMLLSSMLEGKPPMTPLLGSPVQTPDAPVEVAR